MDNVEISNKIATALTIVTGFRKIIEQAIANIPVSPPTEEDWAAINQLIVDICETVLARFDVVEPAKTAMNTATGGQAKCEAFLTEIERGLKQQESMVSTIMDTFKQFGIDGFSFSD